MSEPAPVWFSGSMGNMAICVVAMPVAFISVTSISICRTVV